MWTGESFSILSVIPSKVFNHAPLFGIDKINSAKDIFTSKLGREAVRLGKWAFVADIVRLEKLVTIGGYYLDSDVELLRPLNVLGDKLELGYIYDCALGTAVMYAPPAHPYMCEILHSYQYLYPDKWIVNNTIFTAYFVNRVSGFLLNGRAWEKILRTKKERND